MVKEVSYAPGKSVRKKNVNYNNKYDYPQWCHETIYN